MKIGEIASQAGVTVDTVRFYERVGVLPAPARTGPAGSRAFGSNHAGVAVRCLMISLARRFASVSTNERTGTSS